MREALFNILGPPPRDARVLDLFAGAGALGHRGAVARGGRGVFVDRARTAVRCLRRNLARSAAQAEPRCAATCAPRSAPGRLDAAGPPPFDWVFVDPPYASELEADRSAALGGSDALCRRRGGRRRARQPPPAAEPPATLDLADRRRYGDTGCLLPEAAAMSLADADRRLPGDLRPDHQRPRRHPASAAWRCSTGSIVAIAENVRKQPLFTLEERTAFIRDALGARRRGSRSTRSTACWSTTASARGRASIVRGLRALADFEYEFQFAHMNRHLAPTSRRCSS